MPIDLIQLLGEFLGTMILIILGNGVCYATSHSRMFANQSGKWVVISLGWGIAVMSGVFVAGAFNAPGHLNPAVSIYDFISGIKDSKGLHYISLIFIPMQFAGAIIGQLILNFINWKFIMETAQENNAATRGAHCTGPAFDNKQDKATIFNLSYEFVGTFVLILFVWALGKGEWAKNINENTTDIAKYVFGPFPVALIIMGLGMSLGSATGYALNPARDLGPRIVYALSKGFMSKKAGVQLVDANWSYSFVPVVAPIAAGILMGAFALI